MNSIEYIRTHDRWAIAAFLVVAAVFGLLLVPTYGMGWDEDTSIESGEVTLEYLQDIGNQNATLWTDPTRYYGVAFELPMAIVSSNILAFTTARSLILFRHAVIYLLFLAGTYLFYLFCRKRFATGWLPLIGVIFLFLSPRIFADAFYNAKDIPAMVLFIAAAYALVLFLEKPSKKTMFWLSLASVLLIDIRLTGLLIPALTFLLSGAQVVFVPEARQQLRQRGGLLVGYTLFVLIGVILFWPFLWHNPLGHFLEALRDMSHFSRQANLRMLFAGKMITAATIPWFYVPLWMLVTTPVSYVVLFFIGAGTSIVSIVADMRSAVRTRLQDLVVVAWFFTPILAVIVLHSILYDGWRQMYFIYPALVYLSLIGIDAVRRFLELGGRNAQRIGTRVLAGTIVLNLAFVAGFMIRNHPYGNLYFTVLAGGEEQARRNFDMDYWGLTFKDGLEYIASTDSSLVIPVYFAEGSPNNPLILEPDTRRRFVVVSKIEQARYVLDNYREQQYDEIPWDTEFHSITVDGTKVMTILKLQ